MKQPKPTITTQRAPRPVPSCVTAAVRLSMAGVMSCVLGVSLPAQSLLKDLAPGVADVSLGSAPYAFVDFGQHVYFTAIHGDGRELWRTDGTPAGTELFLDLDPGTGSSFNEISNLVKVGSSLMFVGLRKGAYRLYISDGTVAGTRPFGPTGLIFRTGENTYLVDSTGNVLYFVATDGVHGFELWRSDGTDAGTRMVKDINNGAGHAFGNSFTSPIHLAQAPGGILFAADDGIHGSEPWYSNGNTAGTVLIHDVWNGATGSDPQAFHIIGNKAVFVATRQNNDYNWFSTDGTPNGLLLLSNLGVRLGYSRSILRIGNLILFPGITYQHGAELWRTDGTQLGTQFVADLYPGTYWSNPAEFVEMGGIAYFAARTPNGHRLFRSDGTANGTSLVVPSSATHNPNSLSGTRVIGKDLYFNAYESGFGNEPWISDGSAQGTRMLRDIYPGAYHSAATEFAAVGSKVIFRANDGVHGAEPWITDGTTNGTTLLADLYAAAPGFEPTSFVRAGENAYFTPKLPLELWGTDGTTAGTRRVFSSYVVGMAAKAGELVFSSGNDVWRITSPASTPQLVHRFGWAAGHLGAAPGRLYMSSNLRLWRLDDGASTPVELRSFAGSFYPIPPFQFREEAGIVYFLASEGFAASSGLWRTDGTSVVLIKFGNVGGPSGANQFVGMTGAHGKMWYIYQTSTNSRELWVSDWLSTVKLGTIGTRFASQQSSIVAFRNGVVFAGEDATSGIELWFSDGTASNTRRLADLNVGSGDSAPDDFAVAGDTLFFSADDGTSGRELWRSDGTAAGTARVADIWPGPLGSEPDQIVAAGSGDRVVFAASDGVAGLETWVSDGTTKGTRRLVDLTPGAGSSSPAGFMRVGKRFLLSAYQADFGRELYELPLVATGGWLGETYGEGCVGSAGVPQLAGNGPARVGASSFALDLSQGRANSGATLFVAAVPARIPFGTCEILLGQLIPILRVITDATGGGTYSLPIPNNSSLIGVDLRFQALLGDPLAASGLGLSMTNGLHVIVGG